MTDYIMVGGHLVPAGREVPLYVGGALRSFLDLPLPEEGKILTLSTGTRLRVTISKATGVEAEEVED